jgi:two-component system, OmpR family, copper resistance phosphate regulon response regulator CusR
MRILMVEDDPALNKGIKMILEREGYAVDSFVDGAKALRHSLINHSNYDLFIFDFMLPGKTGLEICTEIRAQNISTPILMLTGLSDTDKKVSALDAGADDYLTKPFSEKELMARVRALLRRPKAVLPSKITFKELILDISNKQAFYNKTKVPLTLKEFGILEYLLRNENQVISRDQILDHVWDFEVNAFSNIVDVHVTNLRKKLEKVGAKKILHTIRGVGYTIKK